MRKLLFVLMSVAVLASYASNKRNVVHEKEYTMQVLTTDDDKKSVGEIIKLLADLADNTTLKIAKAKYAEDFVTAMEEYYIKLKEYRKKYGSILSNASEDEVMKYTKELDTIKDLEETFEFLLDERFDGGKKLTPQQIYRLQKAISEI